MFFPLGGAATTADAAEPASRRHVDLAGALGLVRSGPARGFGPMDGERDRDDGQRSK